MSEKKVKPFSIIGTSADRSIERMTGDNLKVLTPLTELEFLGKQESTRSPTEKLESVQNRLQSTNNCQKKIKIIDKFLTQEWWDDRLWKKRIEISIEFVDWIFAERMDSIEERGASTNKYKEQIQIFQHELVGVPRFTYESLKAKYILLKPVTFEDDDFAEYKTEVVRKIQSNKDVYRGWLKDNIEMVQFTKVALKKREPDSFFIGDLEKIARLLLLSSGLHVQVCTEEKLVNDLRNKTPILWIDQQEYLAYFVGYLISIRLVLKYKEHVQTAKRFKMQDEEIDPKRLALAIHKGDIGQTVNGQSIMKYEDYVRRFTENPEVL
jgi:hypothetical protein